MSVSQQTSILLSENGRVITKDISLEEAATLYKSHPESIYSDLFFRNVRRTRWQILIGKLIGQSLAVSSAVDFGCAAGYYLEGIRRAGADIVRGFDYSYETVKKHIPQTISKFISFGNVMEKIDCGKFELAMSIEVAEHILPEASETFVQNLTNASSKYVVLTAARHGQKGVGHINCHRPQYWVQLFEQNGFVLAGQETDFLRNRIASMPHRGIRMHRYLRHIMVFRKAT